MKRLSEIYHIPQEIVDIWSQEEGSELLPVQIQAIEECKLLEGNSLLITAPSSSGKTFVGEIAAISNYYKRKKTIYLVPMKAIAEEKYLDFVRKYHLFGLKIAISTRDRLEFDDDILSGNFDIAIIIFEKMNILINQDISVLNSCGLVIIDEIQLLNDFERGAELEILLTKIKLAKQEQPEEFQFLGLSAVLENLNQFDTWLNAYHLKTQTRPLELHEGVLSLDGIMKFRNFNDSKEYSEKIPNIAEIRVPPFTSRSYGSRDDLERSILNRLAVLCNYYLAMEKKILIFRKWRPLTRDSAKFLADKLKLLPATRIIHNIQEIENSNSREALIRCLQNGTAFHNSDLSAEERLELEKDFRDENGQIQIICATTTLAMGVNLPSSVVIIPDILKPDSNSERFHEIPLTTSEYKNMSGRAGRTRYREDGISILLSNSQAEAISYWKNYINGQLDTLNPPLRFNDLKKIVLGLFASNLYKNKKEICDFLLSTYTGSIYWNLNDTSRHEFEEQINDIVEYLKKYGLLKEEGELSTTPLGTLCANSGVKIESFILLNQAISRINPNEWDIWEIIFPCLHCLELNDIIRIYIRLDGYREVWEQLEQLDPKNRQNLCDWSNKIIKNEIEVTKRIKLFFMLMDWIEGTDMVEIENRYTLEGGNKFLSGTVKIIAEHTAWMIQTLIGIAQILNSNPNFISDLQILYERVYRGVKAEGIDLHKLKVKGVTRTTIRRLVDNGFSSLDKILETPSQNFRGIINPDIAQRIQDVLIHKIGETQERLKHKQCSRLEKCGYDLKILKDMGIVAI